MIEFAVGALIVAVIASMFGSITTVNVCYAIARAIAVICLLAFLALVVAAMSVS
jgi:hypothetical protein